jgi:hypothetical protein
MRPRARHRDHTSPLPPTETLAPGPVPLPQATGLQDFFEVAAPGPVRFDHLARLAATAVAGKLLSRADVSLNLLRGLSPLYERPLSLCLYQGPSHPVHIINATVLAGSAAFNSCAVDNAQLHSQPVAAPLWMRPLGSTFLGAQRGLISICILSASIGIVCGGYVETLDDRPGNRIELSAVYAVALCRTLVDVLLLLHTATLFLWPALRSAGHTLRRQLPQFRAAGPLAAPLSETAQGAAVPAQRPHSHSATAPRQAATLPPQSASEPAAPLALRGPQPLRVADLVAALEALGRLQPQESTRKDPPAMVAVCEALTLSQRSENREPGWQTHLTEPLSAASRTRLAAAMRLLRQRAREKPSGRVASLMQDSAVEVTLRALLSTATEAEHQVGA